MPRLSAKLPLQILRSQNSTNGRIGFFQSHARAKRNAYRVGRIVVSDSLHIRAKQCKQVVNYGLFFVHDGGFFFATSIRIIKCGFKIVNGCGYRWQSGIGSCEVCVACDGGYIMPAFFDFHRNRLPIQIERNFNFFGEYFLYLGEHIYFFGEYCLLYSEHIYFFGEYCLLYGEHIYYFGEYLLYYGEHLYCFGEYFSFYGEYIYYVGEHLCYYYE